MNSSEIKMYSPSDEHGAIIPKEAPLACSFWKSATSLFMLGKERGRRMEGVETKSLFRIFLGEVILRNNLEENAAFGFGQITVY